MALGMAMLALTDAAFARLCIGATRVSHGRRKRWLHDIAARLDPPRTIMRSRERSRRARVRRKNGTRCYTVEIPDHVAEGVITALVATEKLTEAEACDHARVQTELSRMVCEWAQRWTC
jgi:hypothetical protein